MGNRCSSVDHISLTAQIPLPNFHLSSSGQGSDNSIASYSSASTPSSSVASPSSPWAAYNRLGDCGHSPSFHLHSFSFNDLKLATRNFHPGNFLGEGGFGSVYKGWIHENEFIASGPGHGRAIAVKRLRQGSLQGHKEWLTEVHILGQLHHPNLVKLVGFCADDDHRMLVYEFMSRGSLENHLFQKGATISWAIRMKVIVGAARGLAFLHEAGIIYRDFKTSNILLDSEFNAKLSDFGLAKDGPTGDDTHISTCVMGTRGYAAPEYVATGHLTLKSDVYGFGVVLLEILTGRCVMDRNLPNAEQNLLHWARPYLRDKRKTHRLIDRRLEEGQCSSKGLIRIANLAIHCLQPEAKLRPDMSELLQALEALVAPKDTGDRYLRRRSMERSIKRHRHGRPMYGDNKAISLET